MLTKTSAKGEISVLDPGGYGAVTITKALTIDGGGTFASILSTGTNGITVNALPGDVVILRNLAINGAGTGLNGIRYLGGGALHIVNCKIFGFLQKGIDANLTAAGRIFISNTEIFQCGGDAIRLKTTTGGLFASIEGVRTERCFTGLHAESGTRATARDSIFVSHTTGVLVENTAADEPQLTLQRCKVADCTSLGIRSGPGGVVRMSQTMVVNSVIGLSTSGAAALLSYQDNIVEGNATSNGTPTGNLTFV